MNYNRLSSGLLVPKVPVVIGRYHAKIKRGPKSDWHFDDEFEFDNLCVAEGLIAMLNVMFTGQSVISNWYIGVAQNNYTPVSTDTASSIVGNFGEFTGYSGGARPSFTPVAAAQPTPSINNSAAQALFIFTGAATLTGAFLISSATPGSNSGTLYSAAQFGSSKQVANTDRLLITYTTSLASA